MLQLTTLKELEIGDIFIHANDKSKKPKRFLVIGSSMFNARHGRATRRCINLKEKTEVGKSSPLEVYKVAESANKEAIKLKYDVPNVNR